jgi:hypothetical protein
MLGRRESLRELIRNLHEENQRLAEETREYNREILLRNEKVYTSVIAKLEKQSREIEENTARTRAGTEAILKLLDRFDDPGAATA